MLNNTKRQVVADNIKSAVSALRPSVPIADIPELVLLTLLWAKWIPTSDENHKGDSGEGLVGFFDTQKSINSDDSFTDHLVEICHRVQSNIGDLSNESIHNSAIHTLEEARARLTPTGRLIAEAEPEFIGFVIEQLYRLKLDSSKIDKGWVAPNPSLLALMNQLERTKDRNDIATFYPIAVHGAPLLAARHQVLMWSETCDFPWSKGLIGLYDNPPRFTEIEEEAIPTTSFVAPAWGKQKTGSLFSRDDTPFTLEGIPDAIKDHQARCVYAAHLHTQDLTYAFLPLSINYRTTGGLKLFREKLIRNNWLDTVISLPSGCLCGVALPGVLLVLRHSRSKEEPVLFVDATDLAGEKADGKRKTTEWNPERVSHIAEIVCQRKSGNASVLVHEENLAKHDYSFEISNYLTPIDVQDLDRRLSERASLCLADLCEIHRPPATFEGVGQQEVFEAQPVDINLAGMLTKATKRILADEEYLSKSKSIQLRNGDILFSYKGTLGKAAIVSGLEDPTIPGQAFLVLRLRDNAFIKGAALVQYLRSDFGQRLIYNSAQKGTVPFITVGALKALQIVLPTEHEQRRSETITYSAQELNIVLEKASIELRQLEAQGWMQDSPS